MTEQRETIEQLIVVSVRDHADRSALVAPGRADLTYGDLGRQIDATRQWLAHAGYGRGHRVAVALPNSPEVALAIVAIMCSATCAPINDELTQDDLERLLASMRIDALVAPDGVPSAAADAAQRLGIEVIGLRGRTEGPAGMFDLIGGGSRAGRRRPGTWPC
jgi:acyl-CoA synthetase (AMP-forming)/AMP-acid ligase II